MNKTQILMMFAINPFDKEEDSLFSNKHIMTSKELVNQTWAFAKEVLKTYVPKDTPVCIGTKAVTGNGARVVVALKGKNEGYACTVYSISKRLRIIEEICNMFENGLAVLSPEDLKIATEGEER